MIPDCVLHFLIGDVVLVGNSEEFTYTSHLCGPTFLLYILCEGPPLTRVQEYWDDEAGASVLSFTRVRPFCLSKWSSVWKELLLSVLSWKILQVLNLRSQLLYPGTRICVLASCKSQCRCHLCYWSSLWTLLHWYPCRRLSMSNLGRQFRRGNISWWLYCLLCWLLLTGLIIPQPLFS